MVHGQWNGCAHHLRRSVNACSGVSAGFAGAETAFRPRSVSGRRILLALAITRTRRAHERRIRWRIVNRVADYRDPGWRRLRLHSDKRDLDYGWANLPRDWFMLARGVAGDFSRTLGVQCRIGGLDQGVQEGR